MTSNRPIGTFLNGVAIGGASTNPFLTVSFPRNPTSYDIQYPIGQRWVNSSTILEFYLEGMTSSSGAVLANWVALTSPIAAQTLTGNTGGAVGPDTNGNINVLGDGTTITIAGTPGTNTLTASLVGGSAATNFTVDANTAPGTNPVVPNGSGNITITGAQVASGTVGANVLRTDSLAANAFTIQIQRSTAVAATDSTKNGVAHFDSAEFSVDSSGFVTLKGGGQAIDSFQPDSGTNPVVPDANGLVIMSGSGSTTTVGGLNTLTFELTGLTSHNVLVGAGTTTITKVPPSATTGVPLISQGAAADPAFGTAVVAGGGTGDTSFTAYAPICGGTTTTNPLQSASTGLATANFVLTSNGSSALPSFQAVSASGAVTSFVTDSGTATPSSGVINLLGQTPANTSGVKFTASGSTIDGTLFSPFKGNYNFTQSIAGTSETLEVSHTDNTNTASHAILQASSGGTSGGDPFFMANVGTTIAYSIGVDTPTSGQPLKLTYAAAGSVTPSSGTTLAYFQTTTNGDFRFTPNGNGSVICGAGTKITPFASNLHPLQVTANNPGSPVTLDVVNNDNTSSSSHAQVNITTGGTSGGNSFVFFQGSAQNWSCGTDNAAAQAYKISAGSFGINDWFQITPAGVITLSNAYTMPTTAGTNNYVLTTNGSSAASWQPASAIGAATSFVTDSGTATPSSGVIDVLGQATPNVSGVKFTAATNVISGTLFSPFKGNYNFTQSTAGTSETLEVSHTDNTNAASHAILQASSGGTSGGDPFVLFNVGSSAAYALGIDTPTSGQPLKLTYAAASSVTPSSGTTFLTIEAATPSATFAVDNLSNTFAKAASYTQVAVVNTSNVNATDSARMTIASQDTRGDCYLLFDPHNNVVANTFEIGQTQSDIFKINLALSTTTPNISGTNLLSITTGGLVYIPNATPGSVGLVVGATSMPGNDVISAVVNSASVPAISMRNTNSATGSSFVESIIENGSTGIAAFQCSINGAVNSQWTWGLDANDSVKWKLAYSNLITSNVYLSIATSGAITFNSAYTFPTADGSANYVLSTNGSGTVTWQNTPSGGFRWTVVTGTSQAAITGNGYIANNVGQTVVTLPATSAVGDTIAVTGINNATGWKVAQNAGNTIFFGASTTTPGIGGSLTSTATRDVVYLLCVTANTDWQVTGSVGNLTVV